MSRLQLPSQIKAQEAVDEIYKTLERRLSSGASALCPVDMTRAFLNMCHAQSCGKCVPCRIGLGQMQELLDMILDGKAQMETLEELDDLALSIMESADCAIGYEASKLVHKSLSMCKDDYVEHINEGRCTFRCQYDQPVPCVQNCPANVDIPGYIALVKEKRYADAIKLIRKDNPFPTTCGFICEHPCEARCRRTTIDAPVNIRGLKRMACDHARGVHTPACAKSTGKKIAIIGGGPVGLSAAYFLQLMGHQTYVYEMLPQLGGMLRYGIPNYRLPKDRLDEDIDSILSTGVKVKCNVKIGTDITFQELRADYDAVLIAIGASTDKKLGIEGEEAKGVISAVEFLRDIGLGKPVDLSGQEVCVIGGGNVSMDAVRSAVRLGAKKVSIVYRRRIADMTALPAEIEGAIAEGVEVVSLMAPSSIKVENGKVTGLYCKPMMISTIKDGRASVKATGQEDVFLPCQTLIVAIGQDIEFEHFQDCGIHVDRGRITTKSTGELLDFPGVFAGGDCATGPATVIKAIAASKVVASNIDEHLGFHHEITAGVEIPKAEFTDKTPCGRVNMTEREAGERKQDFECIENCMSEKEAMQESERCLRCDHFGYGIFKGGRNEKW